MFDRAILSILFSAHISPFALLTLAMSNKPYIMIQSCALRHMQMIVFIDAFMHF